MIEVVRFGEADAEELLALYAASFEKEFRDPDVEVRADLAGTGAYRVDGAKLEGKIGGLVRWRVLPSVPATFIVHLAVDPAFRRHGLGDTLLEWPRRLFPDRPLMMEVEHANAEDSPERYDECVRRLAWFAKRGVRTITPTYTQPALHPDTPPMPLNLFAIGDVSNARQAILGFYKDVWGLSPEHPFVRKALTGAVP